MMINTTPEVLAVMQAARRQAKEADLLVADDTNNPMFVSLLSASASVIDCVLEAINQSDQQQFQKNFLVVAKAYNTEISKQVQSILSSHSEFKLRLQSFVDSNSQVQTLLLSCIRLLQMSDSEETTLSFFTTK